MYKFPSIKIYELRIINETLLHCFSVFKKFMIWIFLVISKFYDCWMILFYRYIHMKFKFKNFSNIKMKLFSYPEFL